ncbi:glyoxylate reductase/hydroxypyruvate reductase-like isoform X2 [Cephus cinctus]|nr:glyoxylate reductase/hydroxypyruvate reductase-like isoform X2 [Cephus cinctus]XP_024941994.1 glyoxylate reductase/hydroxypyruvate reductase-like isoform X2 [Cephus cinctus]
MESNQILSRTVSDLQNTKRPKVLVTFPHIPEIGIELLKNKCDLIIWDKPVAIPREELMKKIVGVDGVYCLLTDKIDNEILEVAGPQLKVVGTMSVGYNHLDLKALKARNIHVGYTPGILTNATAELTIALVLATSRRLFEANAAMLRGEWTAWSPTWMCGPGLKGSTVGIVGLGRIGIKVAECLASFDVKKIIYTSRTEKKEAAAFCGQKVTFNELLHQSDFIVVTTALTPETTNLFNEEAFAKMKKTSVFINTSRGEVVDQDALIQALKNKTIWAAGLDVMVPEPIPLDSELLKLSNCVILPHLGSANIETRTKMAKMTAENILAVLRGAPEEMPSPLNIE